MYAREKHTSDRHYIGHYKYLWQIHLKRAGPPKAFEERSSEKRNKIVEKNNHLRMIQAAMIAQLRTLSVKSFQSVS